MYFKRAFIAFSAAIVAAVGFVYPAAAQDKGQVVVASWGGAYQDALRDAIFKPFEKATGITVVEAVGPYLPRVRTMVSSGSPEWDVADATPGALLILSGEGMLQRLDYSAMDQSVFADFPKDAVQPFGVGNFEYATVIAFNTKKYTRPNGPKSWADVWDVKTFPGPRILYAGNAGTPPIEMALLADGVPPEHLYPLDLKRAYAALSRIKPSVVKWATGAAMPPEALISGEAVIGIAPHARIQLAKDQGAPVDFVWDQGLADHTYWTILKGAKNANNAQKFIEFASRAESQAALSKIFIVGPLNKKAFDLIPADRAKLLPTYPENKAKTMPGNPAWWAQKDASGKSNVEINNALWSTFSLQQ